MKYILLILLLLSFQSNAYEDIWLEMMADCDLMIDHTTTEPNTKKHVIVYNCPDSMCYIVDHISKNKVEVNCRDKEEQDGQTDTENNDRP